MPSHSDQRSVPCTTYEQAFFPQSGSLRLTTETRTAGGTLVHLCHRDRRNAQFGLLPVAWNRGGRRRRGHAPSYLLGALILLPGLFCLVELTNAMPKAGGIYYFLDRSLGPLVGTVGGLVPGSR